MPCRTTWHAYVLLGRGTLAYVATSCGADLAVVLSILLVASPWPIGRDNVAFKGTTGVLAIAWIWRGIVKLLAWHAPHKEALA